MFCPNCGEMVEEGVVFCPNCGTKIVEIETTAVPITKPTQKNMSIIIISTYTVLWGILCMLGGIVLLIGTDVGFHMSGELGGGLFGEKLSSSIGPGLFFLGLLGYFALFYGIVGITSAYGVFNLIEWGRKLAIVWYAIGIPLYFFSLIGTHVTVWSILLMLIGIGINVTIIFYLLLPNTRRVFTS